MKVPMRSQPEIIRFNSPPRKVQSEFPGMAVHTESEVEGLVQEGYLQGWEAGQKALNSQLVQQRADLLHLQTGVIASMKQAVQGVVDQTEDLLRALVLEYVQKIVGETAITGEMIEGVVHEALQGVARDAVFELRLHPEDLTLFKQIQGDLAVAKNVEIQGDATLQRGDCVVNTRFGTIDARRATKLNNLQKVLSC